MSELLKVSVLRKSQPVMLEVAEGDEVKIFVKEMTGAQRDEYFNKMASRTVRDANGEVTGMKDFKGLYSTLLSLCVYDANNKPMSEKDLQDWPDSAQKALFEVARDINGLSKEDSEKN